MVIVLECFADVRRMIKIKDKNHYNPVNRKRGLAYAVPMIEEVFCCCAMRVSNNKWAEKSSVLNAAINE